jgi:hypothetical protein
VANERRVETLASTCSAVFMAWFFGGTTEIQKEIIARSLSL